MKHKYIVTVSRTEVVSKDIEVEASSKEEAEEIAFNVVGDYVFNRAGDATYNVEAVRRQS